MNFSSSILENGIIIFQLLGHLSLTTKKSHKSRSCNLLINHQNKAFTWVLSITIKNGMVVELRYVSKTAKMYMMETSNGINSLTSISFMAMAI